ncbi:MAG: hypothetical protein QOC89_61 [Paraburkholderia sp.]|nr:hypothetical protein [Paraburkholderia sp.]
MGADILLDSISVPCRTTRQLFRIQTLNVARRTAENLTLYKRGFFLV